MNNLSKSEKNIKFTIFFRHLLLTFIHLFSMKSFYDSRNNKENKIQSTRTICVTNCWQIIIIRQNFIECNITMENLICIKRTVCISTSSHFKKSVNRTTVHKHSIYTRFDVIFFPFVFGSGTIFEWNILYTSLNMNFRFNVLRFFFIHDWGWVDVCVVHIYIYIQYWGTSEIGYFLCKKNDDEEKKKSWRSFQKQRQ